MKTKARAALALSILALAGAAAPSALAAPFPAKGAPGLRHYRYEVTEMVNGNLQQILRADFDLRTHRDGSIDALVLTASRSTDGKTWAQTTASEACLSAMHAPPGGLATVRLWPMNPKVPNALGGSFLDLCAPDNVFFPLTDILNVAVIPVSPTFGTRGLTRPGDYAAFDGFVGTFERTHQSMKETTHGGVVSLVSVRNGRVTLDWSPEPGDLVLQEPGPQGEPINQQGTEHFAFRLEIDARTGALLEAHTTYDDLKTIVVLPGVPEAQSPHLTITRAVTIEPR